MDNNQAPLQPQVDTSYLTPPVLQPELQRMNADIKTQALPYANLQGGKASVIPDSFAELQSMGVDKRQKAIDYSTPYSEMYAQTPFSGETIARHETFMYGVDNNERLAAKQTTGEKWANGVNKFFVKTGNAVLGGTAGLVYGLGAALNDGSFSSIYDNSFSNTLADWDAKLQYQLPNYYSKQEQEKGFLGQLGTANFWSDKFLGGLSFTAGAIISEGIWAYATGGLSLATAGARLGTKLGAAGRWGVGALGETAALQGLTKYKALYKDMLQGTLQTGKISKALPNALGKAGELASSVGVLARSAGYEASVEALQYKREATENFHQNFLQMNGREPSKEELDAFKTNLEGAANTVFATNMAILMPSNLVTMGHILDIKSPIKTGFNSFIDKKVFGYGIGKTVDAAGKATYKTLEATAAQKIARTGFNYIIKPSVTEGLFEEGLQGVTTKTANKWIEHTYDPKYSNANLDTIGAFYESLGEQYGTKEGWVENGLGMLIGIAGGSINARSEAKQKADELSYQADVAETFQTANLQGMLMPNRLQSANRMSGFSEEARVEAQRGNVAKSALAQKSSLLTFINAKMTMGEDISDIVREVKMGIDSTTEDQWKSAGIEADQIDAHKEETLREFEDLAKDWKANKTYWSYMIGKKLVGDQNIESGVLEGIVGGNTLTSNTSAIIEALAWQSTIGEAANKQMKDAQDAIANELGREYADTVNLNSVLRTQSRDLKQQINLATRSYKIELARRDALVAKIAKLNAAPKQPEAANKPAGKQAAVLTQALLEAEQRIAELDSELQGYAEQINKTSAYQKELGAIDLSSQDLRTDIISGQDLVSLQENLNKFKTVLDGLNTTNPQRASYIDELLKEYSDSEEIFLQNQATQRIISHPDFKLENINSWIQGKVKKSAKMNENTQEWLTDTLRTYQKGKLASMSVQAEAKLGEEIEKRKQAIIAELDSIDDPESDRAKELQAELDSLEKTEEEVKIPEDKSEVKPKQPEVVTEEPLSQLEVYKKRIAEALKGRHNYLTYLGENYDDVANKKPTQAEVDEFIKLREEKKFDDLRYQELQQKLSDWKLLDSAVDEEYVSIGDLILGVEQLEQEAELEDTVDEITPEHAPDIADEEGIKATENNTRYDLALNTNGSMTVKRRKDGRFTLHHLKLSTIADNLGGDFTLKDKDGKDIFFGEEEAGSVLTIEGVQFKVIEGRAIEVKESDFMPLRERLNMYPLNTGAVTWSYSDIYTRLGDDFVKMESDFKDDTINSERIYELKEGDKLTVTLSNDGYNDELFKAYQKAKGKAKDEALKELKDNLKLNLTTTTGIVENVSILKAQRKEVDEHFKRIREKAFELYMAADGDSNINLGIEVTVDGIFMGSPRFTINQEGEIESHPITEREAKEILATGYIENGNIVVNREINDINKTFVGKLSKNNANKKIPIVVFKRGNYNVAYPVTMSKTGNDLSGLFDSIINMRISSQEKVRKINAEIQANKIKTSKLVYNDVYNQQKMGDTRNAFAAVTTFLSAEDFADKNYNIKDVTKDASVNIDLENIDNIITDAKVRIKLDNTVRYKTEREIKYESMIGIENELNDLAQELYKDYTSNASTKYVDSKGDIIEDTGYTDTFDDNPIERPTSQLDKIRNINILRQAFEGITPSLKKIIGKDTIDKVNALFNQYDFVKSQITPNKGTVNSGKQASAC